MVWTSALQHDGAWGFAFNVDPQRGASTSARHAVQLMVTLTFLALNGHLVLIESSRAGIQDLARRHEQPLTARPLWNIAAWGTQLFGGALAVALPGMTALLVVNLAFGVMSRAAPTLNLFAVGFPVTLLAGLLIVYAGLPTVQASFVELMETRSNSCALAGSRLEPWPRTTHKNEQNRQHQAPRRSEAQRPNPAFARSQYAAVTLVGGATMYCSAGRLQGRWRR
jgi:flagellar biosynthesis protein FliR